MRGGARGPGSTETGTGEAEGEGMDTTGAGMGAAAAAIGAAAAGANTDELRGSCWATRCALHAEGGIEVQGCWVWGWIGTQTRRCAGACERWCVRERGWWD